MEKFRASTGFVWAMSGYVVYVLGIGLGLGLVGWRPSGLLGAAVALPAVVAVGYAVVSQIRWGGRREGLERHVQLESLGVAFVVTMLGVVTYALLESFAQFPPLSLWWVWGYGMASWLVITLLVSRKYR
ncbi:hypothetical protein BC739_008452 [Kutzneria viridogrisea]|uniref:DUF2178 domain-containing protein n=2 Tax=Kutzneria TaxID=43356 RepID=A0ABR6BWG9_9PSEU|nr:hypothetical protein [Kutzneria albida]MBA8931205.1 hypothetical protein [Kutzneria viridogrisea]